MLQDVLEPNRRGIVRQAPDGRAYVRLELPAHSMAILR
jgi:hypothetical protein